MIDPKDDGKDILAHWVHGTWDLVTWDTHDRDWRGQSVIGFRFADAGEVIFEGDDFCGSPMHADDSDATIAALLTFLSLKPGDTDAEHFEGYTARQLEWADHNGEELGAVAYELEHPEEEEDR